MNSEHQPKDHKEIHSLMENVFVKFVHVEKINVHHNNCM